MNNSQKYSVFTDLIKTVIDNRGKSVPTAEKGFPLIATNCIKLSSIYPTFENVRYVSDETLRTWFRAHILPNDILLVNKGTPGRACLVPDPVSFCVAQDMVAVRVDENKISYKYLFAVLRSDYSQKQISNFHVGLVIPHFKKGDFNMLMIPRLNIKDQEDAIGDLYLSISEKIELNNKINAELEQLAKTLYEYWFVQFDFPDENGKPYKSSGGKMMRSDELRREIPVGWNIFSLIDLIEESKNGDWGKENADDNYLKTYCIRGADINGLNGRSNFDPPVRYIENTHSNRLLKPNDLIIEISGGSPTQSTGRMAHISQDMLNRLHNMAVCSNFCKAISLKERNLSYIVNQYWNSLYESDIFFNFEGKTSGIKNLLFDQLVKDVKIVLPQNNSLVEKYYDIAMDIDSRKQNNLLQSQKLAELRDWLLPMLMNGQVTVN